MTEKNHLNLQLLEKLDSQHNNRKEVHLKVEYKGKEEFASLYIDQVFRPSKIRECVEEFIDKMSLLRKYNGVNVQEVGEALLVFMLIKHFTSFPAPEEVTKQVKILGMLRDNGLIYQIYAHFDADQLERVQEEVRTFADKIDEHADLYVDIAREIGFNPEV